MPPEPDKPVRCIIHKKGEIEIEFFANHTFSPEQVKWFKAGSALNVVREKVKRSKNK
jgi:aconitate hydratase